MTSEQISGLITSTQLNNGFAALSLLTRKLVEDELQRAIDDTSLEYHRTLHRPTQQRLHNEICGIQAMLKSLRLVSEEFRIINA